MNSALRAMRRRERLIRRVWTLVGSASYTALVILAFRWTP